MDRRGRERGSDREFSPEQRIQRLLDWFNEHDTSFLRKVWPMLHGQGSQFPPFPQTNQQRMFYGLVSSVPDIRQLFAARLKRRLSQIPKSAAEEEYATWQDFGFADEVNEAQSAHQKESMPDIEDVDETEMQSVEKENLKELERGEAHILVDKQSPRMEAATLYGNMQLFMSTDMGGEAVRERKGMTENQDGCGVVISEDGGVITAFVVDEASQSGGGGMAAINVADSINRAAKAQRKQLRIDHAAKGMFAAAERSFHFQRLADGTEVKKETSDDGLPTEGYACAGIVIVQPELRRIVLGNIGDTRLLLIVEKPDGKITLERRSLIQNALAEQRAQDAGNDDLRYIADAEYVRTQALKDDDGDWVSKSHITASIGVEQNPADPLTKDTPDIQKYQGSVGEKVTVIGGSDGRLGDRVTDDEVLLWYEQLQGDGAALHAKIDDVAEKRNGAAWILLEAVSKEDNLCNNGRDADNHTGFVMQMQF